AKERQREHAERDGKHERQGAKAETTAPVVVTLAGVEAQPVEWLWEPWVPLRALTLIDGDPGLGKSTLAIDIAARASRGWTMPPLEGEGVTAPADVLLLGA